MTSELNEMQLLQLSQCATTSKYGLVDKGAPKAYTALAAIGMVQRVNEGYIITETGKAYLKLNKDRLYAKAKRSKKKKRKDEDGYESSSNED